MIYKPDFVDECYKNNDLSLLKNLTLVIPTYNRTFYLSRCLWYHAHFPFGQIIVADSSPDEIKTANRDTVRKIRKTFERDILYLEYEPETETYGGDVYRKWWNAIAHANTEFTQVCTDKEFVIPTVSSMGVKYLNENLEYICAFGNRIEYIKSIMRKKFILLTCVQSYHDAKAIDRLNKIVKSHTVPENTFQLFRTEIKKLLDKNIIDSGIDDLRYGEIAAELLPVIYGKIKQFETPGRVRDLLASRKGLRQTINKNESSSVRYPALLDYPLNRKKQLESKLTQCFSNIMHQSDISDLNEIMEMTNDIIGWWMMTRLDKFSLRLKSFIYKQLPGPIRKILASFDNILISKFPNKKIVKNELKVIKKIILKYEMNWENTTNT